MLFRSPEGGLDLDGLDISDADLAELLRVDPAEWRSELPLIEQYYDTFGDKVPAELRAQLDALRQRLG